MQTIVMRILAVLIGLRGVLNLFKAFGAGSGMVFFGKLLPITSIVAPIVGVYMLVYVFGLWSKRAWAVPMGIAYAVFATLNVILFPLVQGLPANVPSWQYGVFAVFGIAAPWAAVSLLRRELQGAGSRP